MNKTLQAVAVIALVISLMALIASMSLLLTGCAFVAVSPVTALYVFCACLVVAPASARALGALIDAELRTELAQ